MAQLLQNYIIYGSRIQKGALFMYYVGIDIGSTAAKTIVMKDGKIIKAHLQPTGWNSKATAETIKDWLISEGVLETQSIYIATGYGRVSVPYSHKVITEITCHGKGVDYLYGKDTTIIDIGGQDTKIIALENGIVTNFIMNDKCSAGTGRFLEIMSNTLNVSMEELFNLAEKGGGVNISSMCTVFAESEVISLIGQGTDRKDISHGIVDSVIQKVAQLSSKIDSQSYFLTGGLYQFPYLSKALEAVLGKKVTTDPQAQFAGAIGAAYFAEKLDRR